MRNGDTFLRYMEGKSDEEKLHEGCSSYCCIYVSYVRDGFC